MTLLAAAAAALIVLAGLKIGRWWAVSLPLLLLPLGAALDTLICTGARCDGGGAFFFSLVFLFPLMLLLAVGILIRKRRGASRPGGPAP